MSIEKFLQQVEKSRFGEDIIFMMQIVHLLEEADCLTIKSIRNIIEQALLDQDVVNLEFGFNQFQDIFVCFQDGFISDNQWFNNIQQDMKNKYGLSDNQFIPTIEEFVKNRNKNSNTLFHIHDFKRHQQKEAVIQKLNNQYKVLDENNTHMIKLFIDECKKARNQFKEICEENEFTTSIEFRKKKKTKNF